MKEEKILTKHPEGKEGVNINKEKYDVIKAAILDVLQDKELTYTQIIDAIKPKLKDKFEGSISWYGVTVKLDLEARGIIERFGSKPEKYRVG